MRRASSDPLTRAVPPVSIVDKVVTLQHALEHGHVPHAFGGALALAYHAQPRGTIEIDVNIFLPPAKSDDVFGALVPFGIVAAPENDAAPPVAGKRGRWDDTHVDLFFAFDHDFFRSVADRVEAHLFLDSAGGEHRLPFLSADDLAIFKVTFDRAKDWADIEAMIEWAPLDVAYIERWLLHLRGERIWPRVRRLIELTERAGQHGGGLDRPAPDQ